MVDQEKLIIGGEGSQQYAVRNFGEPVAAVNLEERNVRLQNVIAHLEEKKHKERYCKVLEKDYRMPENVRSSQLDNTAKGIERVTAQIKDEFAHACGSYALLEAGIGAVEVRRHERKAFSEFLIKAIGPSRFDKVEDTKQMLLDNYEHIKNTKPIDIPDSEIEELGEKPKTKEKPRSTREDMLRILEDDRAGFHVFTNSEKNRVLPWLDYLEKPDEYPRGIWNQLEEVFAHQQNIGHGVQGGFDAVKSIVYEIEDYLANATQSTEALLELKAQIDELPHYRYVLTEEFGEKHAGYNVLARFADVRAIVRENPAADERILTSKTIRWEHDGPGKHKKIDDNYTSSEPDVPYVERVTQFAEETRVKDARQLLFAALESEQQRVAFYMSRLQDIVDKAPHSTKLAEIRTIAQVALDTYTSEDA